MHIQSLEHTFDQYIDLLETDPINAPSANREYLNGLLLMATRAQIEKNLNDFKVNAARQRHPTSLALFAALVDELCECLALGSPAWTRHPACHSPKPYPRKRDVGRHRKRNLFVYDLLSEFDQTRLKQKPKA
ncbi:hypothetical protein [Hydrogenovibrio halophilus]|uniref:hypothetical protein n=1 Tax=Hydrogenovibrio halophilus TaxID=373391 RepID=UPI000380CBE1|nr:hypothetical protein [Hydrogenovibrio halophilus]